MKYKIGTVLKRTNNKYYKYKVIDYVDNFNGHNYKLRRETILTGDIVEYIFEISEVENLKKFIPLFKKIKRFKLP